jgi:acetolactate synthase I/II/III large subunit
MQYGGRHSQSTYSDSLPDFKTLVEAFGHVGFKVQNAEDLEPVMREAFSDKLSKRTVFVDIWVDPSEHVYPMAIKGGSMRDMYLSKSHTSLGAGSVHGDEH